MQDDNPFATPTVPLVDSQPRALAGWTASRLNLLGWLSLAGVFVLGCISLWLGICLLRVENVYPSFRLMAWLDIAGGVMLMSLLLAMLAPLPLIGALLAQMLLFFRVAAELQKG